MLSIKEFVENALINAKKAEEREIGEKKGKIEVAKALLDRGESPQEIADITGLTLDGVIHLK